MPYRLLAALVCTAASFLALEASWSVKAPLWMAAWAAYGLILGFWIVRNRAPKGLMIGGTLLGLASVLTSPFFIALLWALPAIGLMLHVLRCSFRQPRPLPAARTRGPGISETLL